MAAASNDEVRTVLELRGMSKRFGSVVACDEVDFDLRSGEIHGILGENGAGKSTLMRMVMGLSSPDAGSILIDGDQHQMLDPAVAAGHGIGMVHQQFSLIDALSVWENVALGESGPIDRSATRRRIGMISGKYGLEVDPDARVGDLSAGVRQRVEIIKCLRREPRILILDEPTSILTPAESEHLFAVLREGVRDEGWAVALVSHKLDEALGATDRLTIMRDGRVVDRMMTVDADAQMLARAMVGRPVVLDAGAAAVGAISTDETPPAEGSEVEASEPVLPQVALEIANASLRDRDGAVLLDGLSLEVHPGEILGIVGVEGNGQTPLVHVLSSLLELEAGSVSVDGREICTGVAGAMLMAGVSVIPADRFHSGCVPDMTVAENLVLSTIDRFSNSGVMQPDRIRDAAASVIDEFGIRAPSPDSTMAQLSGGNRQRVVLARALSIAPRVLVAHQPMRGLDVGAVEYVSERLRSAAREGVAVLLLSTDLAEIAALSDRINVIYRGEIIGEMSRADLDMERLGLLIGGSQDAEPTR